MSEFIWNMAVSFQLLFIVISSVIFIYIREKSFKYYALYNIFLVIYVLSRNDSHYEAFERLFIGWLGTKNTHIFTEILSFYVQISFYNLYTIFALYFLDLQKHTKKYFSRVLLLMRALAVLFFILGIICGFLKDDDLYISLYTFLYLPIMLTVFVLSMIRAIKYSGKHRHFFLFGVTTFVCCALIAFIGSFVSSLGMENPIVYFFVGIVIETIFFSLGLAYKLKLLTVEKNRIYNQITKHKHQQEISKLQGLIEGEEAERERLARDLHDGIAGDLAAIKHHLSFLNQQKQLPEEKEQMDELIQIVDKSVVQIREISHNLSPSSITNFGLIKAIENYCRKTEQHYPLKIHIKVQDENPEISERNEIHIYRIIQELINNILKHADATDAYLTIRQHLSELIIHVEDNGKGFSMDSHSDGIGFGNIASRVKFLNGSFRKLDTQKGSCFQIKIHHQDLNPV